MSAHDLTSQLPEETTPMYNTDATMTDIENTGRCPECGSGRRDGDTTCPRCGREVNAPALPPADVLAAEVRAVLRTIHDALCMVAAPSGGGFTCDEADALDALYRLVGLDREADALAIAHASADEDGDEHCYRLRVVG